MQNCTEVLLYAITISIMRTREPIKMVKAQEIAKT